MKIIDGYKPAELAEGIGTTTGTLANWRSKGQGPKFVRIAGRIYYMRADVEQWINAQIAA